MAGVKKTDRAGVWLPTFRTVCSDDPREGVLGPATVRPVSLDPGIEPLGTHHPCLPMLSVHPSILAFQFVLAIWGLQCGCRSSYLENHDWVSMVSSNPNLLTRGCSMAFDQF